MKNKTFVNNKKSTGYFSAKYLLVIIFTLIIITALTFFGIRATYAIFSSQKQITDNNFNAGTWDVINITPTPEVIN